MMMAFLPLAIASRTSIHVISSNQIVFGVGMGFLASEQFHSLPGLRAPPRPPRPAGGSGRCTRGQLPPPMSCTALAAPACDGFCAEAVAAATATAQHART